MRLINQTRNTILAEDLLVADTIFKRLKGLLGRKYLKSGEALLLRPCNSVHTFFMRFPIDILFVDKNNKVIAALSSLAPFRLSRIYLASCLTIELPAGTINSTNTHSGDLIQFE
jgi:uncharacterized protein